MFVPNNPKCPPTPPSFGGGENLQIRHSESGEIQFDNVWFAKQDEYVLQNLNFLKSGEKVALVGPTGAGRKFGNPSPHLAFEPTRGRILVNHELFKFASSRIARTFAKRDYSKMAFICWWRGNIGLGRKLLDWGNSAAEKEQMLQINWGVPQGYDARNCGNGGRALSGDKTVLAFMRVFAIPSM